METVPPGGRGFLASRSMAGNRKAIVLPMAIFAPAVQRTDLSRTCSSLCLDKEVCAGKPKLIKTVSNGERLLKLHTSSVASACTGEHTSFYRAKGAHLGRHSYAYSDSYRPNNDG